MVLMEISVLGGDLNFAKKISNPFGGYAMNIYIGHILDKFKKLPIVTVAFIESAGNIILLYLLGIYKKIKIFFYYSYDHSLTNIFFYESIKRF